MLIFSVKVTIWPFLLQKGVLRSNISLQTTYRPNKAFLQKTFFHLEWGYLEHCFFKIFVVWISCTGIHSNVQLLQFFRPVFFGGHFNGRANNWYLLYLTAPVIGWFPDYAVRQGTSVIIVILSRLAINCHNHHSSIDVKLAFATQCVHELTCVWFLSRILYVKLRIWLWGSGANPESWSHMVNNHLANTILACLFVLKRMHVCIM